MIVTFTQNYIKNFYKYEISQGIYSDIIKQYN